MIHVDEAYEKTTPTLTGELVDSATGASVSPASVSSVKATLYNLDDAAHPTINSRDEQEVLDGVVGSTDELTIAAGGLFAFKLEAADVTIADNSRSVERHMLRLDITYEDADGDTRKASVLVCVNVLNLDKVA